MNFTEFNHISHIIIGTIAFIGGIVALSVEKGSKTHRIGGRIFFLGMCYAAISTIGFIVEEFIPLAVLMSVSTIYLLISSITSLKYKKNYSRVVDKTIVIIPFILFVFVSIQFIRILPEVSLGTFGRLLFAITFAILLFRDLKLIKNRPSSGLFFIKRHAFRMILAFGFAVMAVLRIGVKLDFLGIAFTTVLPLLLSLIAAYYVEQNIIKFVPNENKTFANNA